MWIYSRVLILTYRITPSAHSLRLTPSSTAAAPQSSPWLWLPATTPARAWAWCSLRTVRRLDFVSRLTFTYEKPPYSLVDNSSLRNYISKSTGSNQSLDCWKSRISWKIWAMIELGIVLGCIGWWEHFETQDNTKIRNEIPHVPKNQWNPRIQLHSHKSLWNSLGDILKVHRLALYQNSNGNYSIKRTCWCSRRSRHGC